MTYSAHTMLVGVVLLFVCWSAAAAGESNKGRKATGAAPYNFGLPHRVTHVANLSVSIGHKHKGHVVIGLFGSTVPKAVANFVSLCNMERGFGFVNTTFHRVLRDFIVQGGDFEHGNGKGGFSVFSDHPGRRFAAENFNIPHRKGSVAMASESKTRLGSQFYIVAAPDDDVRFLNGKHVVFGHVVAGQTSVVEKMARVPTDRKDTPKHPITIATCHAAAYRDPQDKEGTQGRKKLLLDDEEPDEVYSSSNHTEGPKRKPGANRKLKKDQKPVQPGPKKNDGKDLNLHPLKPEDAANPNKPVLARRDRLHTRRQHPKP